MQLLSPTVSYCVLIFSLIFFGVLAVFHTRFRGKRAKTSDTSLIEFFSSRNSIGWFPLTVTIYASAIGNWILFTPADLAANYSWVGLIGQTIGSFLPRLIFFWIAPKIRKISHADEFTATDFILRTYGYLPYFILSVVSLMFMWVALTAELLSVANTLSILTTNGDVDRVLCTFIVSVITLAYTAYSGLRASVFTDQFQGAFILILGVILIIAGTLAVPDDAIDRNKSLPFAPPGSWVAGSVLLVSVYPCELMNQGNWQRVFAARSLRDLRISLLLSGIFIAVTVLSFGYGGIFAAKLINAQSGTSGYLLTVMSYLSSGWLVLVLILAVCLASSSIDTMQSALSALIGHHLIAGGFSKKWATISTILINIPAIVVASFGLNVMKVYFMANLLCLTVVMANFLAISKRATKWGLVAGCAVGLLTMLSTGWVKTRSFVGGFEFLYPADLSSIYYIAACVLTPLLSLISVIIVSWLEGGYGKKGKKANSNSVEA